MSALTSQDITQLLAAVEVWEKEPVERGMRETMLSAMISGIGDADGRDERMGRAHAEADRKMKAAETAQRARREEAILLQAKLITLRNELQQTEFTPAT